MATDVVALPSVTLTVSLYSLLLSLSSGSAKVGARKNASVPLLLMLKTAASSPLKEKAKASPLRSLALMVVTAVSPSATDRSPGLLTKGAALSAPPLEPEPQAARHMSAILLHRIFVVLIILTPLLGDWLTERFTVNCCVNVWYTPVGTQGAIACRFQKRWLRSKIGLLSLIC